MSCQSKQSEKAQPVPVGSDLILLVGERVSLFVVQVFVQVEEGVQKDGRHATMFQVRK